MGWNSLLRYMAGSVAFSAQNGFAERLINLCAARNIGLWELRKTPEGMTARCTARDFRYVRELAQKVNVDVSVLEERGLFFWLGRYRKRWGLFAGVAGLLGFLFLSQCFVWEIDIEGNETVPDHVILEELADVGIDRMSFIPGLDFRLQRSEVLLRLPQLSYLSINASGCRLKVHVTERKEPPALRDADTPCDVVAARTGQITYMEVYEGQTAVGVHYTVQEGDVIVSGAYLSQKGVPTLVHADAKVMAEVQFDKTISLDLDQMSKEYTGETRQRYFLDLFSFRLPLFLAFPLEGEFDVCEEYHPLVLFGQEMPVGLYRREYRMYTRKPEAISLDEARAVLEDSFLQYELTELKGSAILNREIREVQKDGVLSRTVSYTAEQNIARQRPIDTEQLQWPQAE